MGGAVPSINTKNKRYIWLCAMPLFCPSLSSTFKKAREVRVVALGFVLGLGALGFVLGIGALGFGLGLATLCWKVSAARSE